jgi:glutaminyl-peptide cyclotransferase
MRLQIILYLVLFVKFGISQDMAAQFSGEQAFGYLQAQCDFGPRTPGSTGHDQCLKYLTDELEKRADVVTLQNFMFSYGSPKIAASASNVIARFQPAKKDRILLCAHWDTRPWADSDPDPANHKKPVLGANDGASGVAVLLHIADLLQKQSTTLGIDIVLFDAEDAGDHYQETTWAQGSEAFAREYARLFNPRFAILLDMIGDSDLDIYQDQYSVMYSRPLVDKIWNKAAELGIYEFIADVGYAVYDDHVPLLRAGIQTVDIIDFNSKYWHTVNDTPEHCSAASLEKVGKVVTSIIYDEK